MPEYTENDLVKQFNFLQSSGWLQFFIKSAKKHDLPLDVLIALASRETNINPRFQRVPGDNGHGFSIMQIDIRSYPAFCKSNDWKDPEKAIDMGASVLRSKIEQVEGISNFHPKDKLATAIAGYNTGVDRAATDVLNGRSPDMRTTEHNYSFDVLSRAAIFKKLLDKAGIK